MRKQKLKTCYKNVTNYHFNHFQANVPILYPVKHQKTFGLMSRRSKWKHWPDMV